MHELLIIVSLLVFVFLIWTFMNQENDDATSKNAPTANSVAKNVTSNGGIQKVTTAPAIPVTFYYGSQTGTSEKYSRQLARECEKHGFSGTAVDLDVFSSDKGEEYKKKLLSGGYSVFLVATYGEGDPTDSAVAFMNWFKDPSLPAGSLSTTKFSVFGLGNSGYEHYNRMGKEVNKRLLELGAESFHKYGEGDDDHNIDDDFDKWRDDFFDSLRKSAFGGDGSVGPSGGSAFDENKRPDFPFVSKKSTLTKEPVHLVKSLREKLGNCEGASKSYYSASPLTVSSIRELRQKSTTGLSTKELELEFGRGEEDSLQYHTADTMYVLPENDSKSVLQVVEWVGMKEDLDTVFEIVAREPSSGLVSPVPSPLTLRSMLTRYCDLHGLVDSSTLEALAPFVSDAAERQLIRDLVANREKFTKWAVVPCRSILETLLAFPSFSVATPAELLQLLPRLRPRAYTIASSSQGSAGRSKMRLCVGVVDAPKPGDNPSRRIRGVCSNYIARLSKGAVVWGYTRPSTFKLPLFKQIHDDSSDFKNAFDTSTPVIMIGPGTGIAPMRAFIEERALVRARGGVLPPAALFFGCRKSNEDYIYREELADALETGVITKLFTAFSRDSDADAESERARRANTSEAMQKNTIVGTRVYVQELIRQNGSYIAELVQNGASVNVCGATKMGNDVNAALSAVLEEHIPGANGHDIIQRMKDSHRYIQELWSN